MSGSGRERLLRTDRLRKRAEFVDLQKSGQRLSSGKYFFVLGKAAALESRTGARIGITVSAKTGNAVVRNRIKRCVREIFRRHPVRWRLAADLVVVARPAAGTAPRLERRRELSLLLDRVRLR